MKALSRRDWWRSLVTRDHVRLGLAMVVAVIAVGVWAIAMGGRVDDQIMAFNVSFTAFNIGYLAMTAAAFWQADHADTVAWARHNRRVRRRWWSRWLIGEARGTDYVLTVTMFAVIAAILLIRSDGVDVFALVLGSVGIVTAWMAMQVAFALRYAVAGTLDGNLTMPDEPQPDMMDFAYLAFTVGTSFTIVDARITDRRLRRVVLGHSLLSFAFNTLLLGLVVSFLAR